MVFVDQPKTEKPPEQQAGAVGRTPQGFQTVVAPDVIPTNIPPVNPRSTSIRKTTRARPSRAASRLGWCRRNEVFMEAIVEEKPAVLSGPTLQFPELLRQAQIQGRVLVQAIIDTLGAGRTAVRQSLAEPQPRFRSVGQRATFSKRFPARARRARPGGTRADSDSIDSGLKQ